LHAQLNLLLEQLDLLLRNLITSCVLCSDVDFKVIDYDEVASEGEREERGFEHPTEVDI